MKENGKTVYFYGTGIPSDYEGEVPEGFRNNERDSSPNKILALFKKKFI